MHTFSVQVTRGPFIDKETYIINCLIDSRLVYSFETSSTVGIGIVTKLFLNEHTETEIANTLEIIE